MIIAISSNAIALSVHLQVYLSKRRLLDCCCWEKVMVKVDFVVETIVIVGTQHHHQKSSSSSGGEGELTCLCLFSTIYL